MVSRPNSIDFLLYLWLFCSAFIPPAIAEKSNHPLFQVPAVSKEFCQNFLEKTFSVNVIKEALNSLHGQQKTEQIKCLRDQAIHLNETLSSEDPEHLNSALKASPKTPLEKFYQFRIRDTLDVDGGLNWLEREHDRISVESICGPYCITVKQSSRPSDELMPWNQKIPGETVSEYESIVGKDLDFTPVLEQVRSGLMPFGNEPEKRDAHYRERRLLSRFLGFLHEDRAKKDLSNFCSDYESEQGIDEKFTKAFSSRRFITKTHWEMAQKHGLTEADEYAIQMYTNSYFSPINRKLRSKQPLSEEEKLFLSVAERAMKKIEPFKGTVWRWTSLPPEVAAQHEEGATVTYDGFTSTSKNPEYGGAASIGKFTIHAKYSARYIGPFNYYHGEEEVLFPPGTKFKVLKKAPLPSCSNCFEYELEELPN